MINKELMNEPVEIEKLLVKKFKTSGKETNIDPFENQNNPKPNALASLIYLFTRRGLVIAG